MKEKVNDLFRLYKARKIKSNILFRTNPNT